MKGECYGNVGTMPVGAPREAPPSHSYLPSHRVLLVGHKGRKGDPCWLRTPGISSLLSGTGGFTPHDAQSLPSISGLVIPGTEAGRGFRTGLHAVEGHGFLAESLAAMVAGPGGGMEVFVLMKAMFL